MFSRLFYRAARQLSSTHHRPLFFSSFAAAYGVYKIADNKEGEKAATKPGRFGIEFPEISSLLTLKDGLPIFNRKNVQKLVEILKNKELKDLPIVVICFTGDINSGKSFFANQCINYFVAKNENGIDCTHEDFNGNKYFGKLRIKEYFQTNPSSKYKDGVTNGINFFHTIYKTLGDRKEVAVLFLDTEGLKGIDDKNSQMLYALATNLASHQVHFIERYVDDDTIGPIVKYTEESKKLHETNFPQQAKDFQQPVLSIVIHSVDEDTIEFKQGFRELFKRNMANEVQSVNDLTKFYANTTLHPILHDNDYAGGSTDIDYLSDFNKNENFYLPLIEAVFECVLPNYLVVKREKPKPISKSKQKDPADTRGIITCEQFANYIETCVDHFEKANKSNLIVEQIKYFKKWYDESGKVQTGCAILVVLVAIACIGKLSGVKLTFERGERRGQNDNEANNIYIADPVNFEFQNNAE